MEKAWGIFHNDYFSTPLSSMIEGIFSASLRFKPVGDPGANAHKYLESLEDCRPPEFLTLMLVHMQPQELVKVTIQVLLPAYCFGGFCSR